MLCMDNFVGLAIYYNIQLRWTFKPRRKYSNLYSKIAKIVTVPIAMLPPPRVHIISPRGFSRFRCFPVLKLFRSTSRTRPHNHKSQISHPRSLAIIMDKQHARRKHNFERLLVRQYNVLLEVLSIWQRKPKWGSTNHEIGRYVYDKYVKKKYVKDLGKPDPLTLYKQTGSINV